MFYKSKEILYQSDSLRKVGPCFLCLPCVRPASRPRVNFYVVSPVRAGWCRLIPAGRRPTSALDLTLNLTPSFLRRRDIDIDIDIHHGLTPRSPASTIRNGASPTTTTITCALSHHHHHTPPPPPLHHTAPLPPPAPQRVPHPAPSL